MICQKFECSLKLFQALILWEKKVKIMGIYECLQYFQTNKTFSQNYYKLQYYNVIKSK